MVMAVVIRQKRALWLFALFLRYGYFTDKYLWGVSMKTNVGFGIALIYQLFDFWKPLS